MVIKHRTSVWLKSISAMVLSLFVVTPVHADNANGANDANSADDTNVLWEVARNEQGIEVSLSKVGDSDYKMFKGEVVISAQVETVKSMLTHPDSCSLWRYKCKSFIPLGNHYNLLINDLPWPLSDRFVVIHNLFTDESTLAITHILLNELPDEQARNLPDHEAMNEMVEMNEYSGYWKVEDIGNGQIKVTMQIQANPAGTIPAALINSGVVENPFNSLLDLRSQVATHQN